MSDTDNWTLAIQHAENEDWLVAATLADRILSSEPQGALPESLSVISACLIAAEWALAAADGELTKRLLLKSLRAMEQLPWVNGALPIADFEECIKLLGASISDDEGAEIMDGHPKVFRHLFRMSGDAAYAHLDPGTCYLDSLADADVECKLAFWCLARNRPHWAVALLRSAKEKEGEDWYLRSWKEEWLRKAEAALQQLSRQLNKLNGALGLSDSYSRDTRPFAFPEKCDVLYAELTDDDAIATSYKPPDFKTLESTYLGRLTSQISSDSLYSFIEAGHPKKTGSARWRSNQYKDLWFEWRGSSAILALLASPLAWLIVWLMPMLWLTLVLFGHDLLSSSGSLVDVLSSPTALAVGFLGWSYAGWSCRVHRFLRIEVVDGQVAWIGVPVPIHKLGSIEADTIDFIPGTEHSDDLVASLKIERFGEFVRIGNTHHRASNIHFWGIESHHSGLAFTGIFIVFMLLSPALVFGIHSVYEYWGASYFNNIVSVPLQSLVMMVEIIAVLGALAFPFGIVSFIATGKFREAEYRVGYYDGLRKFTPVAQSGSQKLSADMLAAIQNKVSELTE